MTSTEKPIVGRVSFANGETQEFTDADKYLICIREEFELFAPTAFRFHTITRDPAIRKAVDDIVFDFYGEEKPCTEEDYKLDSSGDIRDYGA